MNRKIKFRGYSPDEKRWVYGGLILDPKTDLAFIEDYYRVLQNAENGYPPIYDVIEVDPKTVGQFAGLKDKYGVEIYELDILQLEKTTGPFFRRQMIFEHGCFGYYDSSRTFQPVGLPMGNKSDEKMWTVIGNIHENPELLNTAESRG